MYIRAIQEANGMLTVAAKKLGVGRSAIHEMAKRHPEIQEAINETRERMVDFAENKLFEKISQGEIVAILFYLKTIGKSRGYVERQEVDNSGSLEITINRRVIDGNG